MKAKTKKKNKKKMRRRKKKEFSNFVDYFLQLQSLIFE